MYEVENHLKCSFNTSGKHQAYVAGLVSDHAVGAGLGVFGGRLDSSQKPRKFRKPAQPVRQEIIGDDGRIRGDWSYSDHESEIFASGLHKASHMHDASGSW